MSQSLANILVHLIFSTKHREPLIHDEIRPHLNAYVVGILANHQSPSVATNSVRDHMHILLALSKNYSVAKIVEEIKTDSSSWMKSQGVRGFRWQNGYGAFSIGQSQVTMVKKEVHCPPRGASPKGFVRLFLERYQVKYDERYVWD
jgi:REP-associated tyrosine transposase